MATIAEMVFQGGGIRDGDIAQGAGIEATKVIHQYSPATLIFPATTAIAAGTFPFFICNAETSEIVDFDVAVFTAATSGDRTVTIDVHKSTGGAAFASIMSSTILLEDTNAARVPVSGVISDVDLIEGDILAAVITLGGSSGSYPLGLLASLTVRDRPVS